MILMGDVEVGGKVSVRDVVDVAHGAAVAIGKNVENAMAKSRAVVDKAVKEHEIRYGVTTGVGALVNKYLEESDLAKFQRNLIVSHSAGTGNPFSQEVVRAAMFLKANELAKGYSGVRFEIVKTIVEMLNKGVCPVVPEKGSLGASGDLSPLAHMALVVIGDGEAIYKNKIIGGKEAMGMAGIKPMELKAKEALSLINGTQVMAAIGALLIDRSENIVKVSDVCAAMCMESLKVNLSFADARIHNLKPHEGQLDCVKNIVALLRGSELSPNNNHSRVQDAYTIRCTPQVHGAFRDSLYHARKIVDIELNSVTDNPLIFDSEIISGGNFHGQNIATALDLLAISLTQLGGISERRTNRLMDSSLSNLPPFLAKGNGMNSGLMIAQYTAASMASENKVLASPASVDSIPVSANQEDYVSMGMTSAVKCTKVMDNAERILAIELLSAAQAIDLSQVRQLGKGTMRAYDIVRSSVKPMEEDRAVYRDIEKVLNLIRGNSLVEQVEKETGKLA